MQGTFVCELNVPSLAQATTSTLQCMPSLHIGGGIVHKAVRGLQQRKGVNFVLEGLQQLQSAIMPPYDAEVTPVLHHQQQCSCCSQPTVRKSLGSRPSRALRAAMINLACLFSAHLRPGQLRSTLQEQKQSCHLISNLFSATQRCYLYHLTRWWLQKCDTWELHRSRAARSSSHKHRSMYV